MPTFDEWVKKLETSTSSRIGLVFHNLARHLGSYAADRAKEKLGTYQPNTGPYIGWLPLSPVTLGDKISRGFPVPSPLLRTGDMMDSVKFEVKRQDSKGVEIELTADEPADFHEYGTVKMPPRPFLGPAIWEVSEELDDSDMDQLVLYSACLSETPIMSFRRKK